MRQTHKNYPGQECAGEGDVPSLMGKIFPSHMYEQVSDLGNGSTVSQDSPSGVK